MNTISSHTARCLLDLSLRMSLSCNYVWMLESFICDDIERHKRLPSRFSVCSLSPPYDRLNFLPLSRIWRKAAECDGKYPSGVEDAYFLLWHNWEVSMNPREASLSSNDNLRGCYRK